MSLGSHVRPCLKAIHTRNVVERIEHETRKFEGEAVERSRRHDPSGASPPAAREAAGREGPA